MFSIVLKNKVLVHIHSSFIAQCWARDNIAATTRQCFQVKNVLSIALCLFCDYSIKKPTFFKFFFVTDVLLRCRGVVVAKLKNCCVPSSDCTLLIM